VLPSFFVRGVSLLFFLGWTCWLGAVPFVLIFERILWFIFNRNLVMFLVRSTQSHSNYFYISFLWFAIQKWNLTKPKLLYSYACIIGWFSWFKSRRGKQAEINAENGGGAFGNGEGGEGDGSPSAYLNLNGNDEVIHYCIYVSSSNWINCRK